MEAHVALIPKEHRIIIFLTKLKPELRDMIVRTDSVPTTREDLLALVIIQENTLKYFKFKGFNYSNNATISSKKLEDRVTSNSNSAKAGESNKSKRSRSGRGESGFSRGSRDGQGSDAVKADPEHKNDLCYLCSKKRHWKSEYSKKNNLNFTPVNNIQSKNDRAPQKPNKRGKKDQ